MLYLLHDYPKISEKFILDEMTAVQNQGHSIDIIAMRDLREEFTHEGAENFPVQYFQDLKMKGVMALTREKKIQHIHAHFAYPHVDLAYQIHRKLGVPFSFTTHAFDLYKNVQADLSDWCSAAKSIFTISKHNKFHMVDNLGVDARKIHVVRCGVFLNRLEHKKYSSRPFRIVSACRFVEKKGMANLILACKELKQRGVEFYCKIVGDGPLLEELQELINESQLFAEVSLAGSMVHPGLVDFIRSGSVFVLPCIEAKDGNKDGIPVVLMEAMALRIPVISTNLSGIPELVDNRHNGILVSPGSIEELVEALHEIKYKEPLVENIRRYARETVEQNFCIQKNARKKMELIRKSDQVCLQPHVAKLRTPTSLVQSFLDRYFLRPVPALRFFRRFIRVKTTFRPDRLSKRTGSRLRLLWRSAIDGFRLARVFPHVQFCESNQTGLIQKCLEKLCLDKDLGNVFNPSFYIDDDLTIIAFRAIPRGEERLTSYLFVRDGSGEDVFIDISASYSSSLGCEQLIDPKVFRLADEFFISFNSAYVKGGNDVFIMKIHPDPESPKKVVYKGRREQERNWAFFFRDGEVYALYWLNPLKLLKLKSVTENSWEFEDYFCGAETELDDVTIGTQLSEWGGKYYLMAHKKYRAKAKKLYLGKSCCFDFDSRTVKFGGNWFSHSEESLYGHEKKHNDKLFSCTYFSGIQVIDESVVIGYGINDVDYGFSAHPLAEYIDNGMAEIFNEIYENKMWGGRRASEFFSGGGSNDFNTTEYRQYVQRFLTENNVTSVIDLGCGDFRLGRLMDWDGIAYVGIDVVAGVIEKNRKLYASENVTFLQRDMLTESLPNADLCLIRQVFQHLSNEDILAVLPKLSKYRFVLVTDGLPPVAPSIKNANKPTDYNNRFNERYGSGLYLESPPFNLRAEVVLSYPSRNRNETFRTLLKQNTS